MRHNIRIIAPNIDITCTADSGTNMMHLLTAQGIVIDAPCNGCGTCGKCKVSVLPASPITDAQAKFITPAEAEQSVRLACMCAIESDCTVTVNAHTSAAILSSGISREYELAPSIKKVFVNLEQPNIGDQRSSDVRLMQALSADGAAMDLRTFNLLEQTLRSTYDITAVVRKDRIIAIEQGDTTAQSYGIAVDIGTTTVVLYLYNLTTGKCTDITSALNDQRSFGADVISRIDYAISNEETGLSTLQSRVSGQISRMAAELLERNNIDSAYLYDMTVAGNTTMMHLLCGVSPKGIASSPFIPAFTSRLEVCGRDIGINLNSHLCVTILPCISGYIGADTVAAMVACSADAPSKALIVDIGTNGEIALVNGTQISSCSTAAGPAFEGAHIRHGVGGVAGAIDSIKWENGDLVYTAIGNMPPIGICGSAIVDCMAMLLDLGVVEDTGRMIDADETDDENIARRIVEIDDQNAFVICGDIVLTSKDVREIQLAKAAIAAGMHTLADRIGVKLEDLDTLYLAGGFGSYLRRESAVRIGLLPSECAEKIVTCGNAAGSGASAILCCDALNSAASDICGRCEYIELSTSAEFQDWYMECMCF